MKRTVYEVRVLANLADSDRSGTDTLQNSIHHQSLISQPLFSLHPHPPLPITAMSMGLWQTPLPPSVARSRLISNIAAIVLSIFCRTLFSPYLALRSVVISLLDKLGLPGSSIVWWIGKLRRLPQ